MIVVGGYLESVKIKNLSFEFSSHQGGEVMLGELVRLPTSSPTTSSLTHQFGFH